MNLTGTMKALCISVLLATGCLANEAFDLHVMSFNIRYGSANDGANHWNKRSGLVFDVFQRHAPDVVGVQEALCFQLDEIRAQLPEYAEVGIGRDGGTNGEYSAILYRTNNLSVIESDTFWLSDTPEIPSKHWGNACVRICTWARFVHLETKQTFYIYNTHLDHRSQPSREKSVRLILERIRQRKHRDPFVLTGDFNAGEENPAIQLLKANGLVDPFRVLNPKATEVGTFNGFNGTTTGEKIDFIFTESATRTLKTTIVHDHANGRYPSDHFPVTARIQFSAPGPSAEAAK